MSNAWAFRFAVAMVMVGVCVVGAQQNAGLGFFITSAGPGKGADLGGLAGADAHCQKLAAAAGAGGRTWRAYLSATASGSQPAVNAKDRIGAGPWANAKGIVVATSVADLHSDANKLSKENSLTEKGEVVNGRGDTPNKHDILTGTTLDGTASTAAGDSTCGNWTGSGEGSALVGHHDRQGWWRQPDVVELLAPVARVQPGQPARHRRRRTVLLLRRQVNRRDLGFGTRDPDEVVRTPFPQPEPRSRLRPVRLPADSLDGLAGAGIVQLNIQPAASSM